MSSRLDWACLRGLAGCAAVYLSARAVEHSSGPGAADAAGADASALASLASAGAGSARLGSTAAWALLAGEVVGLIWVGTRLATVFVNWRTDRRAAAMASADAALLPTDDAIEAEHKCKRTVEWFTNSRGMRLYSHSVRSLSVPTRGLVIFCHGYTDHLNWFVLKDVFVKLAQRGYVCFGLEYEGHGQSEGLFGLVPSFDGIVDDVLEWSAQVKSRAEFAGMATFLFGESMGGAIALDVHRREREAGTPSTWSGCMLLAPMCKVSDDFKPPEWQVAVLKAIEPYIPTWPLVPTPDILDQSFKVPEARVQARRNPLRYLHWPRLHTAIEILRLTDELGAHLSDVSLPLLLLHGDADTTTSPEVTQALYNESSSKDKTLCMYSGCWHSLLYGETPENIALVWKDILAWLDERS